MKKAYLSLLLLCCGLFQFQTSLLAQCPILSTNTPTVTCAAPCATVTATVSTNLAATTTYSVASSPYTPASFTAGTDAATSSGPLTTWDDEWGNVVPLPFNFCYFGTSYSSCVIGSNGNVTFDATRANSYDPWPISGPLPASGTAYLAATQNCILGPWQDLYPSGGGTIRYATYGTAPCRQFVVSWSSVALYVSAPAGSQSTYQIVLNESTNIINIYIQKRVPYTGWNNGFAVNGICNNTTTLSTFYTAAGENGNTFTATNEGWQYTPTGAVSGWTYAWTGPTGAVGAGASIVVCPVTTTNYTVSATSTACSGVTLTKPVTVVVTGTGTPITGTPTVCAGSTTTLANATGGGTWSSGTPGVATVSGTGVVTGVTGGTSAISYTVAGCSTVLIVTVNIAPPITGTLSACVGLTSALSDAVAGGTWSSSSTGTATITSPGGVVTGVASGVTNITYTTPAGCITVSPFTVNPLPSVIANPGTVCQGFTTTFTDPTAGGTWSSSNTAVATIVSTTGVLTGVSGGTSTITYKLPTGCYITTVATVNPAPTPITGTAVVCMGNTSALACTPVGGAWSSSNTGVATVGAASGLVTSVSAGTTVITYGLGGCTVTRVFTVNPVPAAIINPGVLCQGFTMALTDPTTGGTWTSSNTAVATINSSTGVLTGVSGGTATITYTLAGGCYKTSPVTVNPSPAPIAGVLVVCLGINSALSSTPAGGTWSSTNTSVATIDPATGVVTSVSAGTTTVSYATAGCMTITTFTVNPVPAPIVNPGVVCEGSTIVLTDAASGGTWTSNNPAVASINATTGVLTGVSGGTATISYTLAGGCYKTSPVTVNPLPGNIGGLNRVCATFDISLTNTAAGGVWISSDTTVAKINAAGVLHGVHAGVVTVTYTLPTGCLKTMIVTVYALPTAPVTSDIDYCQRTSGVYPPLTAVTAAGGVLNWYSSLTATSTIPTPTPVTTPGIYTWYVSQTVNQCESAIRTPITVTVHAQSPKPYIATSKPYACQYDTIGIHFSVIPFPGIKYLWGVPIYAIIKSGTHETSDVVLEFDTTYSHNYVTLVTSDGYIPCNVIDTIDVPVKIAPVATCYAKNDVCVGDTVTLALTYMSASVKDYTWDFGTDADMITANSNHGGPFHLCWHQKGDHIIKLNAYNGFNCPFRTFRDTINVHDYPDATIGGIRSLSQDSHVCVGDSVEMFAKTYDGENSYTWAPAQFYNQNNKWSIYGRIYLPGNVKLTVTDPFGCTATDSVYIDARACCLVNFPTAFTPNGDSRNNVFRPITIGNHRIHSFRVVNRWGQVMFEGANSNCAWDGNFNGAPQDMGVYFWFIRYDCDGKTIDEKGDVTLVR